MSDAILADTAHPTQYAIDVLSEERLHLLVLQSRSARSDALKIGLKIRQIQWAINVLKAAEKQTP